VSRVEGSNSINPFIESLLPSKAIITHAHPWNKDAIITAQQPVTLMCTPSTCCGGIIKHVNTMKEYKWSRQACYHW
jgi:hypothetical protein